MNQKIIVLYDFKGKSNSERSRILQKLYGYRDKSNYHYSYTRKGLLDNIQHEKSYKVALELKKAEEVSKVTEILKNLKVKFEIAKV